MLLPIWSFEFIVISTLASDTVIGVSRNKNNHTKIKLSIVVILVLLRSARIIMMWLPIKI